jgi:hypothetical protein
MHQMRPIVIQVWPLVEERAQRGRADGLLQIGVDQHDQRGVPTAPGEPVCGVDRRGSLEIISPTRRRSP